MVSKEQFLELGLFLPFTFDLLAGRRRDAELPELGDELSRALVTMTG